VDHNLRHLGFAYAGFQAHETAGDQLAQRAADVRLGAADHAGEIGNRCRFVVLDGGKQLPVVRRQQAHYGSHGIE
jgi:hypothetical protein